MPNNTDATNDEGDDQKAIAVLADIERTERESSTFTRRTAKGLSAISIFISLVSQDEPWLNPSLSDR